MSRWGGARRWWVAPCCGGTAPPRAHATTTAAAVRMDNTTSACDYLIAHTPTIVGLTNCWYIPWHTHRQLEAPVRQYAGLADDEPLTQAHLAAALTAGLSRAKARRAAERFQLPVEGNAAQSDPLSQVKSKETAASWHGRMVVQAAFRRGGGAELQALMARFREAFVLDMQPEHLPSSWSVHHWCEDVFDLGTHKGPY